MITDNLAIDIRQLHQFLTIVECGSLGRAAGRLKISEPGLSKSVRRLEDRLEVPLFDRSRRGVALTPYGRVFAERARLLTSEWRGTLDELGELRGNIAGISRVGTSSSFAGTEIVTATRRLHEALPGVRAIVSQRYTGDLIQAVLSGALDFAIFSHDGEILEPELVKEPVGENRVVVAARAGHPLAGPGPLTPADLAREPWIVPLRHDPLRAKLETLFARNNLEPPTVLAEASALLFMLAYLRGTDALVYLPERVLLSSGSMGDFAILPVPAFDWRPQALIVRRRGTTLSPAVRTHIRLLKEAMLERAVAA